MADHETISERPDIVVLGGGVTAGMLAAVLARHGVRTLLLAEHDSTSPGRGVNTLPFSSFFSELIAARYDVPEITGLGRADRLRGDVSARSGAQRTIGFAAHTRRHGYDPALSAQFNLPSEHGESLLYRPDVDAWIQQVARRRGAVVRTDLRPVEVTVHTDSVEVTLDDERRVRAQCLVDTRGDEAVGRVLGGTRNPPAERSSPALLTARVSGMPGFEDFARPLPGAPRWSEGVLHHVGEGSWVGITHFGGVPNAPGAGDIADVTWGRSDGAGEATWSDLLHRMRSLPLARAQLGRARPLRIESSESSCWVSSRRTADRILLLDQAAFSGDPMFARDLTTSTELVYTAAADLLSAFRDRDFRARRFDYLDRLQLGMARAQHRLACAVADASTDPALYSMLSRVWLLGTMFAALTVKRVLKLHGTPAVEHALAELRSDPERGTSYPVLPEYRSLWESTLRECELYGAGAGSGRRAAARISGLLEASSIVPPVFDFADPDDRVYALRFRKRLRMMRWAGRRAPGSVRRLLLSYGLQGEGKAT